MVSYDEPVNTKTFNFGNSLRNSGAAEDFQVGYLSGSKHAFFFHRSLFAVVEKSSADIGAIDVQKQQDDKGDDHIGDCISKMRASEVDQNSWFIFGSNSQRPISS